MEYRDTWYMDDEQLSKKVCQENNESNDDNANVVYECCACDEAKFEVCIHCTILFFIFLFLYFLVYWLLIYNNVP